MNTSKRLLSRSSLLALVAAALSQVSVPTVRGEFYTDLAGIGLGSVPDGYFPNDDGSFGPYFLGFSLGYFGATYTDFYLNNNGNISFGSGFSQFTPEPLDLTSIAPTIAPYWADVDTRPTQGGTVYFNATVPEQIVVTWDQVGYYGEHTDKLASFQMVLRSADYPVPTGEGQLGFFYKAVEWETGDASGGFDGFGGMPATVGFGDGLPASNPGEISVAGSGQPGISAIVSNQHFWFNLNEEGEIAGSTQDNPILPTIGPGGELVFTDVPSGFWYDPPFTSAFLYSITSPGDVFAEIMDFPVGFMGLGVEAEGIHYGPFGPGNNLVFPGGGVEQFIVYNILPAVDAADPLAFPLQIRFGDASASFTMEAYSMAAPIPEAGTVSAGAIMALGGLGLVWRRKVRRG